MKTFAFEVAHGYEILRCVVSAKDEETVIKAANNGTFQNLKGFDCIDTFECEVFTEGYEFLTIWSKGL